MCLVERLYMCMKYMYTCNLNGTPVTTTITIMNTTTVSWTCTSVQYIVQCTCTPYSTGLFYGQDDSLDVKKNTCSHVHVHVHDKTYNVVWLPACYKLRVGGGCTETVFENSAPYDLTTTSTVGIALVLRPFEL